MYWPQWYFCWSGRPHYNFISDFIINTLLHYWLTSHGVSIWLNSLGHNYLPPGLPLGLLLVCLVSDSISQSVAPSGVLIQAQGKHC